MPSMGSRSAFGSQKLSRTTSAPSVGFGTATREDASKGMERPPGEESPGPLYLLPASVGGKQPDGRKKDPPTWRFGTGERFSMGGSDAPPAPNAYVIPGDVQLSRTLSHLSSEPSVGFGTATRENVRTANLTPAMEKTLFGREGPGPSAPYQVKVNAIGKQVNSKFSTMPHYTIQSKQRIPAEEVGDASPGPMYALPQSMGVQPEGRRQRAPTMSFGSGTRAQREKVFITREHSRGQVSGDTPGPAAPYYLGGSLGKQVSSRNSTRPGSAFGRAKRFAADERERRTNSVPGPGSYND